MIIHRFPKLLTFTGDAPIIQEIIIPSNRTLKHVLLNITDAGVADDILQVIRVPVGSLASVLLGTVNVEGETDVVVSLLGTEPFVGAGDTLGILFPNGGATDYYLELLFLELH